MEIIGNASDFGIAAYIESSFIIIAIVVADIDIDRRQHRGILA